MNPKLWFLPTLICLVVASGAHAQPASGLVASYSFDGHALDGSGNGRNGSVYGATFVGSRCGSAGSAAYFDGVDDTIVVPTDAGLRSAHYSVAFWIQTTAWPSDTAVPYSMSYHHSTTDGNGYQLEINSLGGLGADQFTQSTMNFGGGAAVGPVVGYGWGDWHHVVLTWDGSTVRGYLDGGPIAGGSKNSQSPPSTWQTGIRWTAPYADLVLGFTSNPSLQSVQEHFQGHMDDLYIYNRALSDSEIAQLYSDSVVECPIATEETSWGSLKATQK